MKKLIAIAAAIVAVFTLAPATAEAGYKSRVIGKCQHCHGSIYSYYKPVRYSDGCTRYAWVPAYHSNCSSRSHYAPSSSYYSNRSYYRPTYRPAPRVGFSIRFGSPGYSGYRGGYCR